MKLRHAILENFRGLEKLEIDFLEDSATGDLTPRSLTCLVGDNGAGKTSALQAVGLALWLAGGVDRRVDGFAWQGFLPERIGTLGKTRIELAVEFSDQEVALAKQVFERWLQVNESRSFRSAREWFWEALDLRVAKLVFENGSVNPPPTQDPRAPFLGRWCLDQIAKMHPELSAETT